MTLEKHQKKIAVINDLSGYGRCSLTVAIPILSVLGIQVCPVPTSVLSNHTGFPNYFFDDYTEKMIPYLNEWKKLDLKFDGIFSGFLGSEAQIEIVIDMIKSFKNDKTKVIIDPIMGDHGKVYQTYTSSMCSQMERLVRFGNIVTPNLTEACILTKQKYREDGWKRLELSDMAKRIQDLGPSSVVITGVREGRYVTNVIAEKGKEITFKRFFRVGCERSGTGDVFSSIIAGEMIKGETLTDAVEKAASFVKKCILKSEEQNIPVQNGVCFEELLPLLLRR